MGKESFNRIVDALEVKYILASRRKVISSSELKSTFEQKDILVYVEKGFFSADQNHHQLKEGTLYLIPRGNSIDFRHGNPPYKQFGSDGFTSKELREQYLVDIETNEAINENDHVFSILGFEVLVHGAIPFFSILEIPNIRINNQNSIQEIFHKLVIEEERIGVGKSAMLTHLAGELVIHLCRYIYENAEFENNLEKVNFLLDKRLINIIQHIQDNLDRDLSNHLIAEKAFVSKDYIGQFFKSNTNHNLQDYIESRRLDKAHYLLRTTNNSIHEIALKVGFKDPAYFSRRFKIRFNKNAKEVRRNDFQVV